MLCAQMLHVSEKRALLREHLTSNPFILTRLRKSMVFSLLATAMISLCNFIGGLLILRARGRPGLALSLLNGKYSDAVKPS